MQSKLNNKEHMYFKVLFYYPIDANASLFSFQIVYQLPFLNHLYNMLHTETLGCSEVREENKENT